MEEFKKNLEKFLPFLEDLRHRLYIGVILFIVFFIVGFLSAGAILKKIVGFINIDDVTLAASSPFQFVEIAMNLGFFLAILITAPYIVYSFYVFILPALTKSEKINLLKSVPMSLFLFISGSFYGFFILFYALGLLASVNTNLGIANFWNIGQFLSQMLITSALLGLIFEFPLLLTLLIKLGVMTSTVLKDHRRIAYFLLLFLTVLLPPTDGLSLLAMMLPLVLLYEATIFLNTNKYGIWVKPDATPC